MFLINHYEIEFTIRTLLKTDQIYQKSKIKLGTWKISVLLYCLFSSLTCFIFRTIHNDQVKFVLSLLLLYFIYFNQYLIMYNTRLFILFVFVMEIYIKNSDEGFSISIYSISSKIYLYNANRHLAHHNKSLKFNTYILRSYVKAMF